jgi:AraC family transcriptional regulator, arabinose operon regulatory protein
MSEIAEARHTAVLELFTGHFHEGSGYRIRRQEGVGDWLLIATLGGRGRFGHAGGDLVAEPGDWVLIRPGTLHDYGVESSLKQWELLWAHFQPRAHWLPWLDWPTVSPGLMILRIADGAVTDRFREVHRLFTSDLRRREAYAMNALEALLLECDRLNPLAETSRYDQRIRRAMDYLERNLSRKVTLAEVADAVGLSPSRLAHLFREQSGQTPQRYLEGLRMQRATELLQRTGFSIKQIADAVGFESPFYFSRRFKARTKRSPVDYRVTNAGRLLGR